MSNRALITGIGKKYEMSGSLLPPLKSFIDLNEISDLLKIKSWDSIDHIDDNDQSILDTTTNKILSGEKSLPTKENILTALKDIIKFDPDTSNLLFYYTGHGLKDGRLYMVTYDEKYFKHMNIDHPPDSLLSDKNYIDTINDLLEKNQMLKVVTLLDCCFAGCMIDNAKQANKFLDRHAIFCAVGNNFSARGADKTASIFTHNFCRAVNGTSTYLELQNRIMTISGSPSPEIFLPNSFHNIVHLF